MKAALPRAKNRPTMAKAISDTHRSDNEVRGECAAKAAPRRILVNQRDRRPPSPAAVAMKPDAVPAPKGPCVSDVSACVERSPSPHQQHDEPEQELHALERQPGEQQRGGDRTQQPSPRSTARPDYQHDFDHAAGRAYAASAPRPGAAGNETQVEVNQYRDGDQSEAEADGTPEEAPTPP